MPAPRRPQKRLAVESKSRMTGLIQSTRLALENGQIPDGDLRESIQVRHSHSGGGAKGLRATSRAHRSRSIHSSDWIMIGFNINANNSYLLRAILGCSPPDALFFSSVFSFLGCENQAFRFKPKRLECMTGGPDSALWNRMEWQMNHDSGDWHPARALLPH